MNELERFRSNAEQGRAPGLWLTLQVDLGKDPDKTLERFLQVIHSWISVVEEVETTQAIWPTDEQWKQLLPAWFIDTFNGHTPEEIHKSDWLWDYGSWLDSMKNRVWRWWSYQRNNSLLTVQLQLTSWPYSIGAVKYLARVAGGELLRVEE